jgi:hypothetical protein
MTEHLSTIRLRGANVIDHLQQASGKLWREGFHDHANLIGGDVALVAALIDAIEAAEKLEQMGPAHKLDPVPESVRETIRQSNDHETTTPRSELCWRCRGDWDKPIEPNGTTTWADRYHEQGEAWAALREALGKIPQGEPE